MNGISRTTGRSGVAQLVPTDQAEQRAWTGALDGRRDGAQVEACTAADDVLPPWVPTLAALLAAAAWPRTASRRRA